MAEVAPGVICEDPIVWGGCRVSEFYEVHTDMNSDVLAAERYVRMLMSDPRVLATSMQMGALVAHLALTELMAALNPLPVLVLHHIFDLWAAGCVRLSTR